MSKIIIERDENNRLIVKIHTERLVMESVSLLRFNDFSQLFNKKENMETFADGEPLPPEKTAQRMQIWIERWMNNDPFSALSISIKDTDEFIGYVVLGHLESAAGCADLSYVLHKKYWGNGYGKESVTAIVNEFIPELIERGYKVGKNDFIAVTASARQDNVASCAILKRSGLKFVREDTFYGRKRSFFSLDVKELIKKQSSQATAADSCLPKKTNFTP